MLDRNESVGNPPASPAHRVREVAAVFLKLGFTAFGGPAAHVAMMRNEVVTRRRWVTDAYFLDLLGATNLIPGPNSTEMSIHLGFVRAGWRGLLVGGLCFASPAMVIVLALAWAYVHFGATPEASALLYGIKPVIIAIILQALWGLGRTALRKWYLALAAAATLGLYLLGGNELALLFGVSLAVTLGENIARLRRGGGRGETGDSVREPGVGDAGSGGRDGVVDRIRQTPAVGALALLGPTVAAAGFSLWKLFLIFLKIGAVLYGSGYVLLAFLRNDLVIRLGWLTDRQLLDAISIGQFTPGPLFTSATFIGYVLGGVPGALLATLGIFAPSFVFVALTNPLIPRMRQSTWAGAFLDGVNAAAIGLMGAVTLTLGRAALLDAPTVILAVVAALLLIRFKVNSAWLVIGGAAAGLAVRALMGG